MGMDPQKLRRLTPLITADGQRRLASMRQDIHAPKWNSEAGDMLTAPDIDTLKVFRDKMENRRTHKPGDGPPNSILAFVREYRHRSLYFMERTHEGMDLSRDWALIGLSSREDIATRPETMIPLDMDLERMVVYRTAGSTGHSLYVPNDPVAVACYQPMLDFALARHGVASPAVGDGTACFLVGAQARTVTYPTVLSWWDGAGFAKINLNPDQWPGDDSARRYFEKFAPAILTGDPISFSRLAHSGIETRPTALVTTAVAMSDGLRKSLSERFRCPVIDWYSLTETGPIGYACPVSDGYHVLAHDIYVEAVDEDGAPVGPGERGEIAITGGRNPFLPLLRYRTGDWGAMDYSPCQCGDPAPRITMLEGRRPVMFRRLDGSVVNPVDISSALRPFSIVQTQFEQGRDLRCRLVIRPHFAGWQAREEDIRRAIGEVMGDGLNLEVEFDPTLGDRAEGKVISYKSDFLLED